MSTTCISVPVCGGFDDPRFMRRMSGMRRALDDVDGTDGWRRTGSAVGCSSRHRANRRTLQRCCKWPLREA
jgi:hypothetical protein